MLRHWILDDHGEPVECDLLTWARWFENDDSRRVAYERIGNTEVSTVFLGIDHGFTPDGQPILWETMVFGKDQIKSIDEYQCRYRTRAEALAGHAQIVALVKGELN